MRCPLRRPTAGEQSGSLCEPVRLSRTLRECCKSSSAYESLHVPRRRLTCEDDEIYFCLVIIFWTGFGGYRPTSDAIVHFERNCLPLQTLLSYFRCFLAISDAIVHFRTISSNFEHCRLILDANVRIRTLSSDFKSFYSIPEAIV